MTKVRIMLAPTEVSREVYFKRADGGQQDLARENLSKYHTLPPMVFHPARSTSEDIAEEMFDLTNNPNRDDERQERYGNGRSLSIGDIVDVDGELWLCTSNNWAKIN